MKRFRFVAFQASYFFGRIADIVLIILIALLAMGATASGRVMVEEAVVVKQTAKTEYIAVWDAEERSDGLVRRTVTTFILSRNGFFRAEHWKIVRVAQPDWSATLAKMPTRPKWEPHFSLDPVFRRVGSGMRPWLRFRWCGWDGARCRDPSLAGKLF